MSEGRGVVLVGYRACGKSHLARYLGELWRCPQEDADQLLEERAGSSIAQIFAEQGEAHFRDLEAALLAEALQRPGTWVLATGGGVVEREANRALLMASPHLVVYLQAPVALILERLRGNSGDRPALSAAGLLAEVPDILARREPWYTAVADMVLDAALPIEQRAQLIAHELQA